MFSSLLKSQDYFGYQIHINYKDKGDTYRTTHTSIISLLLNCFFVWALYFEIDNLVVNKSATSTEYEILKNDANIQNINKRIMY